MAINSQSQTTVKGLDELIKAFMELPEEAIKIVRNEANEEADKVLTKSKNKAPVGVTGNLKAGLKRQKAGKSAKYPYRITAKVTFTKDIAYAVPVELGHGLVLHGKKVGVVKEKPFLRPAADESKDDVVNAIANGMNKAVKQMGGRK